MSNFCQTISNAKLTSTLLTAGALLLWGCNNDSSAPTPELGEGAAAPCTASVGQPDLACAAPPSTFATADLSMNCVSTSALCLGKAWDAWAWSSFAALNWPALASSDAGNYPSGFVRGVPDTSKAFGTAASTDVSVWETFKEKRELFNSTALPGAWQQLTFDPKYAPEFSGGQIQMCASADAVKLERVKKHPRVFARVSKAPTTGTTTNTGDETAEVASPAQESTDALCAGFTSTTRPTLDSCEKMLYPPQVPGQTSVPYTASGPNPQRYPVGPRVFKGSPAQDHFLYYEVKVNYDYYAFVTQPIIDNGSTIVTSLNDYATAVRQASNNLIELPVRTSAASLPSPTSKNPAVLNYSAAKTAATYQSLNQDAGSKTITTLPGLGSIQLKAAWVPSKLLDGDPTTYHLTDAVYYKDSPSQPNGLCYDVEQFGLIGLHIIQRVHAGAPGGKAEPAGGTYIFATWEHQSIGNGAGYSYVNYSKFATNTETPFPNTAAGLAVARLKPYPLPTTQALDLQVQANLPNSVWKNYRLIGTQFMAMDVGKPNAEAAFGCSRPASVPGQSGDRDQPRFAAISGATSRTNSQFEFCGQRRAEELPVLLADFTEHELRPVVPSTWEAAWVATASLKPRASPSASSSRTATRASCPTPARRSPSHLFRHPRRHLPDRRPREGNCRNAQPQVARVARGRAHGCRVHRQRFEQVLRGSGRYWRRPQDVRGVRWRRHSDGTAHIRQG